MTLIPQRLPHKTGVDTNKERGRGRRKGMVGNEQGSRRDASQAPGAFFFFFFHTTLIHIYKQVYGTYCHSTQPPRRMTTIKTMAAKTTTQLPPPPPSPPHMATPPLNRGFFFYI